MKKSSREYELKKKKSEQNDIYNLFSAIEEKKDEEIFYLTQVVGIEPNTKLIRNQHYSVEESERYFPKSFPFDYITLAAKYAWHGNEAQIQYLLEKLDFDFWSPSINGRNPIWLSMLARNYNTLDYLKNKVPSNFEINILNSRSGKGEHDISCKRYTMLMEAVMARCVDGVRFLVSYSTLNINAKDRDGRNALHLNLMQSPYEEEDKEIAKLLIEREIALNEPDIYGLSAKAYALTDEKRLNLEANNIDIFVPSKNQEIAKAIMDDLEAKRMHIQLQANESEFIQIQKSRLPKFKPKFSGNN